MRSRLKKWKNYFQIKLFRSSLLGMVLCFISSMLLSLGTLMVSRMTEFHPITKSFWRFLGTFVPSIFVIIYYSFKKESISASFWPLRKGSVVVFVSLVVIQTNILPVFVQENLRKNLKEKNVFLFQFRSFFGCTAATLQYYSLNYMSLGDSSVICNSYPIFVTILAYLFLKEPFGGIFMFIAMLVTFLGVTMILRPPILTGETVDTELMVSTSVS